MTAALHPDYTAELALFGQLVGEWKVAHQARQRGGPGPIRSAPGSSPGHSTDARWKAS
jgi:hypothetical protein